jgi:hypothetical protein
MSRFFVILIVFLAGCQAESSGVVQKPGYLKVFGEFQESPMYNKCDQFEEKIKTAVHDTHRILPYTTKANMEINEEALTNGSYRANISCEVEAIYSFSATTFVTEKFIMNLGELSFQY